jgi:glutathione S-transferase
MTTMPRPVSHDNALACWQAGTVSAAAAMRPIWDELRRIEAARQELEQQREALRDQLRHIVAELGGSTSLTGYGKLEILPASVSTSYVKTQVDALIIELTGEHPAIAARLAACRKESHRAGGLRVTPEKTSR